MESNMKRCLVFCLMFGVLGIAAGCAASGGEGVAIYLTRNDIPPSRMEMYSHVELSEQPIIGADDIVTYNTQTFELKLTPDAFARLCQLEVPTSGKSFLVCVNKSPVYWGAFWTPLSSQSFDGVTIWKPYDQSSPPIVNLELGYPASSFYSGEDPRNKQEIVSALRKAGKLITALTLADIGILPRSMKGYEIYSWPTDDDWHFTLITGTNRNKTQEEIVSGEDHISEQGWILIHCSGEEELKTALAKIPAGDWVILLDGSFVSGGSQLTLPPPEIADRIKAFAREHGLQIN
jgi:hypothetical protein